MQLQEHFSQFDQLNCLFWHAKHLLSNKRFRIFNYGYHLTARKLGLKHSNWRLHFCLEVWNVYSHLYKNTTILSRRTKKSIRIKTGKCGWQKFQNEISGEPIRTIRMAISSNLNVSFRLQRDIGCVLLPNLTDSEISIIIHTWKVHYHN